MAWTVAGSDSISFTGAGPQTLSYTWPATPLVNPKLIVGVLISDTNPSTHSVTLDPGGADEAVLTQVTGSPWRGTTYNTWYLMMWYLDAASMPASSGARNIVLSYTLQDSQGLFFYVMLEGMATGGPTDISTPTETTGSTTSVVSLSALSTDFCIDMAIDSSNTGANTPDTGQTDLAQATNSPNRMASYATGETTMGWTEGQGAVNWLHIALAFAAASSGISQALPIVTEVDSVLTFGKVKQYALPNALETDTAQSIGISKQQTLPIVLEADQAQTFGREKVYALTPATETDLAITITLAGGAIIIALQPALETDVALTISGQKEYVITPATEAELAQAFIINKEYGIVPASETDQAIDLLRSKLYPLSITTELDSAIAIILQGAGATLTPADIQAIVDALIADGRVMTLQKWLIWREIL